MRTFERRLNAIERYHNKGRLLDIGCAFGFFVEVAQNHGWDAFGVEISPYSSKYCRDVLGLSVFTGELADQEFADEYFDVVTLWETLGILIDPLGVLRQIHRILRPSALLVITTPRVDSHVSRLMRGKWLHWKPEHLHYFSDRTVRAMLDTAGFQVFKTTVADSGKYLTLGGFMDRLSKYSALFIPVKTLLTKGSLSKVSGYINPLDMMMVYSRKG